MKYIIPIPLLIITVYLLTNLVVPATVKGETLFLANAALWATVIIATLLLQKFSQTKMWRTKGDVIQLAVMVAVMQLILAIFFSFFMGFGANPSVWTLATLTVYFPYLLMPFLAIELSRAYLTKAIKHKESTLNLLLISLFYTFILSATILGYASLITPLAISEFLIKTFIPTLAVSVLATYLASLGGFKANLTYMLIPAAFSWFSPILPNPPWTVQSIATVMAATIGFLIVDQTITPSPVKRIHPKILKEQKTQLASWTAIILIGLVAVWSSVGLLGFTPTIIGSGSMQPTLNPGDITIVISAPINTIQRGDIVQYRTTEAMIIHRVIDTYTSRGTIWFITKGDANNDPDPDPVGEDQVVGKAIFTIPQLGWVSIALKEFPANAYTFLTIIVPEALTNGFNFLLTNGVYITSALVFTAYSYLLLTYKARRKGGAKNRNE
jgi:signal peptidase